MSVRLLSTEEMLSVSGAWLDPEGTRGVLERYPLLAGLLDAIAEAHKNLSAVSAPAGAPREAVDLLREALDTDRVHDRKGRGVHAVLTGLAELADTPEAAQQYLDLRDRLFPLGLGILGQSYRAEAEHAARMAHELDDPACAELLRAVSLPHGGTLADELRAHLEAGKKLGDLEVRRAALQGHEDRSADQRAATVRARNAWISVASAVEANLLVAASVADDDRSRILDPLRRHG